MLLVVRQPQAKPANETAMTDKVQAVLRKARANIFATLILEPSHAQKQPLVVGIN
jgi:hypothetical protein